MKRLLAALLSLAIALSLSACGRKEQTASSAPSSSSEPSSKKPSSADPSSSELNSSVAGPAGSNGAGSSGDTVIVPVEPSEKPILPESFHAYDALGEQQREYYNNMLQGIKDMQTGWIVLGETGENYQADIAVVRTAVLADHPEIFWLPPYYATAEATSSAGVKTAVVYFATDADSPPSYLCSVREKDKMEKELKAAVDRLAAKITASGHYEIELQLHDLLCSEVEYSDDPTDPSIYTAYGALINKKALCEGYSRAMQLLLQKFSIPATVVTGVADEEDHMWNRVFVQGEWYNLDLTWNDIGEEISHEYFNLSDELISVDHTFHPIAAEISPEILATGLEVFNLSLPEADGTEYNYFNHSGFVLFSDGVSALAAYLTRVKDDFVEVRFASQEFRDRVFASSDDFIGQINEVLTAEQSDCGFRVGGYSVSTSVLRLYKKKL